MNGSQSSASERLLTPRPDDDTKISGVSKSNGSGAVDLTADDSDDSDDCNNTTIITTARGHVVNAH